jgi:imidazolonepropionase-like amidohydrolase
MGFFARYNAYRSHPAWVDRDGWVARRFDTAAVGDALVRHTRLRFEQPPASEQQLADGYPAKSALFRRLLTSNLRMVVGSDAGSQGHFHGDAIWWELRAWRDHGASVAQLVSAATVQPARLLRLPDRGALMKGARADFILYRGDLTGGELDVAKVSTVAKAGVLFVDKGRWIGPVEPGTVH